MQVEMKIIGIPVSILLGILIGIIIGSLMIFIFRRWHIRDTKKVLLLMGVGVFLTALEDLLKDKVEIAALLGVMTIGFLILEKVPLVAKRLSVKFSKIWVFAEILLFVLVGAQVNIQVALDAGLIGGIILLGGLIARSIGVLISNIGTSYTVKEKGFIVIAYLPKATVQAAIGAKALEMGVVSGDIILAIAVLSIMVTAPLGAIGISMTGKRWL